MNGGRTVECESPLLHDVNGVLTEITPVCVNINQSLAYDSTSSIISSYGKLCSVGYSAGVGYDKATNKWKWNCKGTSGTTVECSANANPAWK
jgi:hypothetical protein